MLGGEGGEHSLLSLFRAFARRKRLLSLADYPMFTP